ncbi:FlgO family outer membrane protein [Alishewanella sp. d11]|uniref:FlgO family outer membrane protein n=1 Tax=Alishewanella sp. d11 TaxID=3414030 RepID=UPI003BF87B9E
MRYPLAGVMLVLLGGCAYFNEPDETVTLPVRQVSAVGLSPQSLGFYTERLANQLFNELANSQHAKQTELAVTSFLPIRPLSLSKLSAQEIELANQLAESMLTEAVQRGYAAVDIRLRREILLQADHEQALSRQLTELKQQHHARLLLSGTYSAQEDGFIVNVRLIDIVNQQVLAAATDYVPDNVLWSAEKMRTRGNYFYRSDRIGERQ